MSAAISTAKALDGWREGAADPLPERLSGALERAVLDGRIPPESRLPSERDLATALNVSRSTISGAYDLLRAGGWLETRHGSGSLTRLPSEFRDGMAPTDGSQPDGAIDLRRAAPAAPIVAYREAMQEAMDAITPSLAQSYSIQGLPSLREAVAQRHSARGVPTGPENILVTSGALPALWLVLAALFKRAPTMVFESPTYLVALEAARHRRSKLIAWPVVDGWDIAAFERLVRANSATAAYVVPDFHNPTGRLMAPRMRKDLVEAAREQGLMLIVDETMVDIDLRPKPTRIPPVTGPNVITLGSMSKTIWDGLRVGWVRAEADAIAKLAAHPLAGQVATPPLEQAIGAAMMPRLDTLLGARRRALRLRRDHLIDALEGIDGIRVDEPPLGGLSAWATLDTASAARLARDAVQAGVLLHPGGRFAVTGGLDHNLRLPFSLPAPMIDTALSRLAPLL